jgi:hypothetical protein
MLMTQSHSPQYRIGLVYRTARVDFMPSVHCSHLAPAMQRYSAHPTLLRLWSITVVKGAESLCLAPHFLAREAVARLQRGSGRLARA